jgi:hypothetical protein
MDKLGITLEYETQKKFCTHNFMWFEIHDTNEKFDFTKKSIRIRFEIYTDKNYRTIRKYFPNYEISKSNKKTIGWQNQYLVSYDYKKWN